MFSTGEVAAGVAGISLLHLLHHHTPRAYLSLCTAPNLVTLPKPSWPSLSWSCSQRRVAIRLGAGGWSHPIFKFPPLNPKKVCHATIFTVHTTCKRERRVFMRGDSWGGVYLLVWHYLYKVIFLVRYWRWNSAESPLTLDPGCVQTKSVHLHCL